MIQYQTLDDNALMKCIRLNDELAFTELYNRYWEQLLAVAFSLTHDKQTAEDLLQEVMLSLWTRRSEVVIHSPKAYLATALKFSVFKYIARNTRHQQIKANLASEKKVHDLEERLEAKFLHDYLKGEIEQFPETTKLIFHYQKEGDLTIKEIAEKMNLSPKSIEYHLTKAVQALRHTLQKLKLFFV